MMSWQVYSQAHCCCYRLTGAGFVNWSYGNFSLATGSRRPNKIRYGLNIAIAKQPILVDSTPKCNPSFHAASCNMSAKNTVWGVLNLSVFRGAVIELIYYRFNLVVSYVHKTSPFGKVLSNHTLGKFVLHLLISSHLRRYSRLWTRVWSFGAIISAL